MANEMKDAAISIADRIRNPYFGSVIASWLVVNWKLVVVAVSDTGTYLKKAGVPTYIDYVLAAGYLDLAVYPLVMSVISLIVLRLLRMGFSILDTYISKKTSEKKARIMRGHFVPVEKLLELREDYKSRIKEAAELVANEDKYRQQAAAAELCRQEAEDQRRKITETLEANARKLAKMSLQGDWYVEIDTLGMLNQHHIQIDVKKKTATYANDKDSVAFVFREIMYNPASNKAHILMLPMEFPFILPMISAQWIELDYGPDGDYTSSIIPFMKVYTKLKLSRSKLPVQGVQARGYARFTTKTQAYAQPNTTFRF